MKNVDTKGLVLFTRHYRERDLLVKIFTESFGKRMFFIKNASKSRFTASLQPFTVGNFNATINADGLSFLNDVGDVVALTALQSDLDTNAHASVIISLADEVITDGEYDPALYDFLVKTLELMNAGVDSGVLMSIFEIQLLSRFGVRLNLTECAVCGRRDLPLDFSVKFDGCLCKNHWAQDPRRQHLEPNTLYLVGQFQEITLSALTKISVNAQNKQKIQDFISWLFDEYVGVKTRAMRFLEKMPDWEIFKLEKKGESNG
ncbi:MAG: DNA repair protein RecO [Streptococcaceae bacterium]|jgi:DNA repair protein RecO (recombination protein O)|nr:DNA repair protein RecO [Streptococcaceae bacterium]